MCCFSTGKCGGERCTHIYLVFVTEIIRDNACVLVHVFSVHDGIYGSRESWVKPVTMVMGSPLLL